MSRAESASARRARLERSRRARERRRAELEALIDEATIESYSDDDAFWGLFSAVEQQVRFPFPAKALGDPIEAIGIDVERSGSRRGLRILIRKGKRTYAVAAADLVLVGSFRGRDWLDAYLLWEGNG